MEGRQPKTYFEKLTFTKPTTSTTHATPTPARHPLPGLSFVHGFTEPAAAHVVQPGERTLTRVLLLSDEFHRYNERQFTHPDPPGLGVCKHIPNYRTQSTDW